MSNKIRPVTARVNGVEVFSGKTVNEMDLQRITDESKGYFKYNTQITKALAKAEIEMHHGERKELEPMQGVVVYVHIGLYEVVWRDTNDHYWRFVGLTPSTYHEPDSQNALDLIEKIEKDLELKFGEK
jgi:hypothetical protein